MAKDPSTREQLFAGTALGAIIVITIGWWMLALWPVPAEGAEWVVRTRAVCFGSTESGMPAAEGWGLLFGQPVLMAGLLLTGWGRATGLAIRRLAATIPGRLAVTIVLLLLGTGIVAAFVRVDRAQAAAVVTLDPPARPAAELPRLDRPAPNLNLVDQHGQTFTLDRLRGRRVLLTFAFAHCETVCPTLVRDVRSARDSMAAAGESTPAVVVVTVDPWRDTPARLPSIADDWGLQEGEWILSGEVDEIRASLEAWSISISRDARTGDVIHPAAVYILDRAGRIAFLTTGGGSHAAELLRRLD